MNNTDTLNWGSYDTLSCRSDQAVAWITLNRPDRLNTFTEAMHAELRDALTCVGSSAQIRCLVLTGEGRGFCAGQDLSDLDTGSLDHVVEDNYNPLIRNLTSLNMPVIASVNGVAAGAGANLALACDLVLAARSATFIQSFNHVGLIPDAGGTWSLPRLVGHARAMGLAMTGEAVSAEQAEDWGMIWKCVDDESLQQETAELAHRLAGQATIALTYTRLLMQKSSTNTLDQQLDLERDFQKAASRTSDFQEGLDAFLARRKPRFQGR